MKEKIIQICENNAANFGCTAVVDFEGATAALPVNNYKKEAENVQRVAEKVFGVGNVTGEGLPISGSEDFSSFIENTPGAFFFIGIGEIGNTNIKMNHTSDYDFNDETIAGGGLMWVRLVEDRFNTTIIQ